MLEYITKLSRVMQSWSLGCQDTGSSGHRLVFLVCASRHHLQSIVGQRPLQRLRLISGHAHPDVALLTGRQDPPAGAYSAQIKVA
jgi:hypothetical protein